MIDHSRQISQNIGGGYAQHRNALRRQPMGSGRIMAQGIRPGEQLILDGLDDLRAGTEVAPVPVQIDAQGVVREIAAPVLPQPGLAALIEALRSINCALWEIEDAIRERPLTALAIAVGLGFILSSSMRR